MEPFDPTATDLPVTQPIDISALLESASRPRVEQADNNEQDAAVPGRESPSVHAEGLR